MRIPLFLRAAARPARLRSMVFVGAAALSPLLSPLCTLAADQPVNETFNNMDSAIQMLRSEVGKDRREIVKSAMLLTQSEGTIFWPLYDQYRGEIHALGDRRVHLIEDFVANRNAMSEDHAAQLTKEALSIEEDTTSVKQDYVKKMSKVLSARTVARFFQIDGKLDAAVNAELAARIPLIH